MNLLNKLLLSIFTLPALTFSTASFAATQLFNKADIYGGWLCSHDFSDADKNLKMKISYNINFNKNGTSNGEGALLFTLGGLPPLTYQESDNAIWEINEEHLTISFMNIQFTNISHPELEDLLKIKQKLPKKANEKIKIVKLTNKHLMLQSQKQDQTFNCDKKVSL